MATASLIRYRLATIEDLDRLVDFQIALGRETEALTLDTEHCRAGLAVVFTQPQLGQYYVAEHGDRVVGCLSIVPEYIDWLAQVMWWVHNVYVEPTSRRMGILTGLFAYVRARAATDPSVRSVRLYVHQTNMRAKGAYERLGFVKEPYELYEWLTGGNKDHSSPDAAQHVHQIAARESPA